MKSPLHQLLAAAKSVQLLPEEKTSLATRLGISVRESAPKRPQQRMSTQKFLQTARKVSLSPVERAQIREGLLEAISVTKMSLWWLMPFKNLSIAIASVLIVVIASGTGVSYAAESAMPGDLLYPVKIYVNETVQMQMKRTAEEKAAYETVRVMRRLHEAEALATAKKLDDQKAEQIRMLLHEHIDRSMDAMKAVDTAKKPEVRRMIGDLNMMLKEHGGRLAAMNPVELSTPGISPIVVTGIHEMRMAVEEMSIEQDLEEQGSNDALPPIENVKSPTAPREKRTLPMLEKKISIDREPKAEQMLQAEVRLRMARKRMQLIRGAQGQRPKNVHINAGTESPAAPPSARQTNETESTVIDTEAHVSGTEQLIDIAVKQIEVGDSENALSTADMALRHAEGARRRLQKESQRQQ